MQRRIDQVALIKLIKRRSLDLLQFKVSSRNQNNNFKADDWDLKQVIMKNS